MPRPRRALALVAILLATTGGALAAEVPLPPPRPEVVDAPASALPALPPLPPERPAEIDAAKSALPAEPQAATPLPPERPAEIPVQVVEPPIRPDDTECRARLATLGVTFEPLPPIADGLCGTARPLRVTGLPGGLTLTPAATTVCPVAEALGLWSRDVHAAAEQHFKAKPTKVTLGGSYECRGQNHDPNAKMSEHAFADAVDVMGFGFEKHPPVAIAAQAEGTPEFAFQAEIRAKACAVFTTVLGPGSDPSHANHLHLDLRDRKADYRICQ